MRGERIVKRRSPPPTSPFAAACTPSITPSKGDWIGSAPVSGRSTKGAFTVSGTRTEDRRNGDDGEHDDHDRRDEVRGAKRHLVGEESVTCPVLAFSRLSLCVVMAQIPICWL